MSTKQELQSALKEAMKSGDETRKRAFRMALSGIRLAEDQKRGELDENEVLAVLQKEVKSQQETIEDAQRAGRPELQEQAEAEIAVLEEFLPKQLNEAEIESLAQEAIDEVGASDPRQMGQVMKVLVPRLEGRATGQQASQAVRKLLQSENAAGEAG